MNTSNDAQLAYQAPTPLQLADAADVVRRFAAEWNQPAADNLRSLMHADTQNLIPPMRQPADREGVVEHFRQILQQLPDMRLDIVRWAPTGDIIMIEWAASATVAGRQLHWTGIDRMAIRAGRIYQAQVYWDTRRLAEDIAQAIQQARDQASAAATA
ncbi:MAG: nuclear transport factor 2 family protein [Pseudomonadota bacterium]